MTHTEPPRRDWRSVQLVLAATGDIKPEAVLTCYGLKGVTDDDVDAIRLVWQSGGVDAAYRAANSVVTRVMAARPPRVQKRASWGSA